jgi:hypothetical protein
MVCNETPMQLLPRTFILCAALGAPAIAWATRFGALSGRKPNRFLWISAGAVSCRGVFNFMISHGHCDRVASALFVVIALATATLRFGRWCGLRTSNNHPSADRSCPACQPCA